MSRDDVGISREFMRQRGRSLRVTARDRATRSSHYYTNDRRHNLITRELSLLRRVIIRWEYFVMRRVFLTSV